MYLASPMSLFILQRWPRICRFSSLAGLALASIGIVLSSFVSRVWQLILTQGVLYAVGAFLPCSTELSRAVQVPPGLGLFE